MTWEEFQEWFSYHATGFTGLHSWLRKFPETPTDAREETQPTQERILQRWFRVLESTELADAKRASDLLHDGTEAEPKGFDKHPGAVRAIAAKSRTGRGGRGRQQGPRYVNGEEVVDCLLCQDWGRFSVWHPCVLADVHNGKPIRPPYYTCARSCTCHAGEPYRRNCRTFDPRTDLPLRREDADGEWRLHDTHSPDEHAAVTEFVAGIAPNHEDAFDGFS